MTRTRSNTDPAKVRAFAIESARTCFDMNCEDVVILDVTGQSPVCDFIVVATGTSVRQMKSVAQSLENIGKEQGNAAYRSSRDTGTTWVVVDFVETVVHLFEAEQRLYYDIEALWQSGSQVEWQREDHE